jgi:hypothetical protein
MPSVTQKRTLRKEAKGDAGGGFGALGGRLAIESILTERTVTVADHPHGGSRLLTVGVSGTITPRSG